ncbi:MAG: hypothetical protein ACFFAS_19185, partial [Promethearchaeota archaeon]
SVLLSNNKLTSLPESITKLASLQRLNLRRNQLSTLPESIGNLTSLTSLLLSANKLTSLPESIGNLSSLQKLSIWDNQLTTLPESIGNFSSLQRLGLRHNQLTTLPESITKLASLQRLDLIDNQLTTLPESIGNLASLQKLKLGGNQLTTLPESIGNLTSLTSLLLSGNKLMTLPESIGNLSSLQTLRVNDFIWGPNNLTTLPESFSQLRGLKNIDLSENNWTGEWAEIAKKDIPTILQLCRKLHGTVIFISHAMTDEKKYRVVELSKFLEEDIIIRENGLDMNIVHDAIICETDVVEDIWDFMTKNVPLSHLLLFVATKNSIKSEACQYELFLANKYNITILPIKGADITWEELKNVELINRQKQQQGSLDLSNPKKKFEFNGKNFNNICKKLSAYLKTHESELKKAKKKGIERLEITKKAFVDSIRSIEFKALFKDNLDEFDKITKELNNDQITILEYHVKLGTTLKKARERFK